MKILLTGATGFLGSRILNKLLTHENVELTCTAHTSAPLFSKSNLFWIQGDLSLDSSIDKIPTCDVVIHSIKSRRHREFPEYAQSQFDSHVATTMRLLEWARKNKVAKFILVSTGTIYGSSKPNLWRENDLPEPDTFYGASKLASENLLKAYTDYFDASILRVFTLYGPGQTDHLIPSLIEKVRLGEPIQLIGGDGLKLTPSFSEDIVNIILHLISMPVVNRLSVMNICGNEHLTIKEISSLIGKVLNKAVEFESLPGSAKSILGDNSLVKTIFSDVKFTPFELGLMETVKLLSN